jgi:hypothetical protein
MAFSAKAYDLAVLTLCRQNSIPARAPFAANPGPAQKQKRSRCRGRTKQKRISRNCTKSDYGIYLGAFQNPTSAAGTIVIFSFTPDRVVVAADSRGPGIGTERDNVCKIFAIDSRAFFFATEQWIGTHAGI